MSVNLALSGAPIQPKSTLLTTTDPTVVVAGSDKTTTRVTAISVVNADSSARIVELEWNDGTTDATFWRRSVPANETIIIDELVIPLTSKSAAQTIKATAAAANVVTITVCAVEDYTRTA